MLSDDPNLLLPAVKIFLQWTDDYHKAGKLPNVKQIQTLNLARDQTCLSEIVYSSIGHYQKTIADNDDFQCRVGDVVYVRDYCFAHLIEQVKLKNPKQFQQEQDGFQMNALGWFMCGIIAASCLLL